MPQISNKSGSWLSLLVFIAASHALMPSGALAQQAEGNEGRYAYVELIGKGFISVNVDWKLGEIGRVTAGLTLLDYELDEVDFDGNYRSQPLPSPSAMVFALAGKNGRYLEAGLGASINPMPWRDFRDEDSAYSFHGSIGYRRQIPGGRIVRFGFTPFYRVNWAFLPLIGLSIGHAF